jgi:hypothetical protein
MSDTRGSEAQPEAAEAEGDAAHPAGPHAKPELTDADATPGAGSLPDPEGDPESAGGTG